MSFFIQLFSELCITDPAMTSKAGVWSSPYAELNCKKSLFLGVPPSLAVLDVLRKLQRPGLPCVWYLCKELGPGVAFGRRPGHSFQHFGSQGALTGQTTAQPGDWWAMGRVIAQVLPPGPASLGLFGVSIRPGCAPRAIKML